MRSRVSAIVPVFNERNISRVLRALNEAKNVDEIIVVDDGSNYRYDKIVRKFEKAILLKNKKNMGKGYSISRGVKSCSSEIVFFCDSDLIDLTSEIVDKSIAPVLKGEKDMFISIRGYKAHKALKFVGMKIPVLFLAGERALKREIWIGLPTFYKRGFRMEIGLNYYAKRKNYKIGHENFPYYQIIKEKKYDFKMSVKKRMRMNLDIVIAYLHAKFFLKTN